MKLTKAMIIFALRYCLVSASYAPMACTRYLMDHWSEFDPNLQNQIREEIQQHLAAATLDKDIFMTWDSFLQHIAQPRET